MEEGLLRKIVAIEGTVAYAFEWEFGKGWTGWGRYESPLAAFILKFNIFAQDNDNFLSMIIHDTIIYD